MPIKPIHSETLIQHKTCLAKGVGGLAQRSNIHFRLSSPGSDPWRLQEI